MMSTSAVTSTCALCGQAIEPGERVETPNRHQMHKRCAAAAARCPVCDFPLSAQEQQLNVCEYCEPAVPQLLAHMGAGSHHE